MEITNVTISHVTIDGLTPAQARERYEASTNGTQRIHTIEEINAQLYFWGDRDGKVWVLLPESSDEIYGWRILQS